MRFRLTLAASVVAALVAVLPGSGSASPTAGQVPPQGSTSHGYGESRPVGEVTLVTGDVVTVSVESGGALSAEVTEPAPRADGKVVLYDTVRDHEALYIFPSDAFGLVQSGRVDPRLFDVAYLAKHGYTDAKSGQLPVIVQYPRTVRDTARLRQRADALPASKPALTLASVNSAAVRVDKPEAERFWAGVAGPETLRNGVGKLWLDAKLQGELDRSVPMIGAPQAWDAGYDGTGVKVAVLDTGIDATHPDLAGKVAGSQSFVGTETAKDGNGHGTHVASTIVGSGAASGGKYKGVAPGAELLVGKVLDDTGWGSTSQIIAGMQWAVAQGADVVSMSLGGCCSDGTDPAAQAVNALSAQSGSLFVVAAGNNGSNGSRTINTPGAADAALTVAAVDKQDKLAPFSSRGPRYGDYGLKPDIAAPGVDITAARADGTQLGPIVDGKYVTISGTSMATPHVAGAAAILAQQHPDWTGTRLKSALTSTAKDDGYGAYEQGAGRVDLEKATAQGVFATSGVDFGRLRYEQTAASTKPVTYTNDTGEPVTLRLTASITPHRETAPPGALRLGQDEITVPAHGSASVDVTFDPAGVPQTWYEGAIRATADGVSLVTPVGAFRELKRITLNGRIILPEDGSQFAYSDWRLMRIDDRDEIQTTGTLGTGPEVGGQLYAGHYVARTFVTWRDSAGESNSALVVVPDVDASNDTTVTFDLRKAKPVTTKLPAQASRPADPWALQFGFTSTAEGGKTSLTTEIRQYGHNRVWTLPTGPQPSLGDFYAYNQRVFSQPRLSMRIAGTRTELDARYQVPNAFASDRDITRFDGRRRLPVVYAGSGMPADFEGLDVRGKLVLLDLSDLCGLTCTSYAADRVANAAAAGAAGVLGFGSAGRGFLDSDAYASRQYWPVYPVPTVSVSTTRGRALRDAIAARSVSLDVQGRSPKYTYTLSYPWRNGVPANPAVVIGDRDLFRVDNRIHADGPGSADLTWNTQLPLPTGYRVGDPIRRAGSSSGLNVRVPGTVTTYFGPVQRDLGWTHGAGVLYDAPAGVTTFHRNGGSDSRMEEFTRPGRRVDELNEQPQVPNTTRYGSVVSRYMNPTCLSCRNGDMLNPVHVLSSDGTGGGAQAYDISNGTYGDEQTELHLYQNGTELPLQTGIAWIAPPFFGWPNPYFTLSPERATIRLTEHFQTFHKMQKYARVVDTEWTFISQRPTTGYQAPEDGANCMGWYLTWPGPRDLCQATGQLFVGYDLGLRLDNTLPPGHTPVTISAYHSPFLQPAPRITDLRLWTSVDDGRHWTPVRTRSVGGGRYAAMLLNPRPTSDSGGVSLKVRAVDATGATVTQTVERAFGVQRHSTSP